jgi:2'-5' RNA ligase
MTLPDRMTDRWARRADPAPGERTLYWHLLMSGYPQVVDLVGLARQRLEPFSGMHLTPLDRLHMTTLVPGPAEHFTGPELQLMLSTAAGRLATVPPITVSLGEVRYYPEAIILMAEPAAALAPVRAAAEAATSAITGSAGEPGPWTPHVTICYSTADQDAGPIIDALGRRLPACEVSIDSLSLVVQDGSELLWNWTTIGTVRLRR